MPHTPASATRDGVRGRRSACERDGGEVFAGYACRRRRGTIAWIRPAPN